MPKKLGAAEEKFQFNRNMRIFSENLVRSQLDMKVDSNTTQMDQVTLFNINISCVMKHF